MPPSDDRGNYLISFIGWVDVLSLSAFLWTLTPRQERASRTEEHGTTGRFWDQAMDLKDRTSTQQRLCCAWCCFMTRFDRYCPVLTTIRTIRDPFWACVTGRHEGRSTLVQRTACVQVLSCFRVATTVTGHIRVPSPY